MTETIIKTGISFLVTGALGYLIGQLKNYKKKLNNKDLESKLLREALMTIFQNNLTNTYWVYEKTKNIPDYVYKNWLNSMDIYEKLGGNDYCHTLQRKMENWNISKTDILVKNNIM